MAKRARWHGKAPLPETPPHPRFASLRLFRQKPKPSPRRRGEANPKRGRKDDERCFLVDYGFAAGGIVVLAGGAVFVVDEDALRAL